MLSEHQEFNVPVEENEDLMKHPLVQDFLEDREIQEEDHALIEEALTIPRQTYLENHNTPSLKRENLGSYMEGEISRLTEEEPVDTTNSDLKYAQVMLEICKKYNWSTAWGLNTVMEKVAPKTPRE